MKTSKTVTNVRVCVFTSIHREALSVWNSWNVREQNQTKLC